MSENGGELFPGANEAIEEHDEQFDKDHPDAKYGGKKDDDTETDDNDNSKES